MKVYLQFKTPDVIDQLHEDDQVEGKEVFKKFIKFGECITVVFDTESLTAKVLEV